MSCETFNGSGFIVYRNVMDGGETGTVQNTSLLGNSLKALEATEEAEKSCYPSISEIES